jgi:hypothetical protein
MAGRHRLPDRRKREYESPEFAAMLVRMIYAYGARIGNDPAALTHLRDIETALRDATNAGIAAANRRPDQPYSLAEIADITGISRQAIHKRVRLGERVLTRLAAARGNGAVVRLADMRRSRADGLAAAGLPDRTSPSPAHPGPAPGPVDHLSREQVVNIDGSRGDGSVA